MKRSILILMLLALAGCESPLLYEGSARVVFEGRVTDKDGHALANIPVKVAVRKEGQNGWFLWPGSIDEDENITYAHTDAGGHYAMVFPRPINQDEIAVVINTTTEGNVETNPQYSSLAIRNILTEDIAGYGIDFGHHSLYTTGDPTATLTIAFEDVPEVFHFPISVFYTAVMPQAQAYYNTTDFPEEYYDNYPYPAEPIEITVAQNQQVGIGYTFMTGSDTIKQHLVVPVGTAPVTHTIQY